MPKPVKFVTLKCGKCACNVTARDKPTGIDVEDVAIACKDDPNCPKRQKKTKFSKAVFRFKVSPHAWSASVQLFAGKTTGKMKPKLKSKWSVSRAFSESSGSALLSKLRELALTGGETMAKRYSPKKRKKGRR